MVVVCKDLVRAEKETEARNLGWNSLSFLLAGLQMTQVRMSLRDVWKLQKVRMRYIATASSRSLEACRSKGKE